MYLETSCSVLGKFYGSIVHQLPSGQFSRPSSHRGLITPAWGRSRRSIAGSPKLSSTAGFPKPWISYLPLVLTLSTSSFPGPWLELGAREPVFPSSDCELGV